MIRPNHDDIEQSTSELPRPIAKPMRWPFPIVWIVPIIALGLAGYYWYTHYQSRGPELLIHFTDASGLKPGQSILQLHGVQAGLVSDITLSGDQKSAVVKIELKKPQATLGKQGTLFWIVRPEINDMNISGLSTVVSGPYIDAQPGDGPAAKEFTGLDQPPLASGSGLKIILHSEKLEHLQPNSPIYYHGFQVGLVQDIRLSEFADQVNVTAFIWPHYAPLVRADSQFWSVSGADVRGGVFSGVKIQLDSLRALISGGIAFATPTNTRFDPAPDGMEFGLHAEANKDWLTWAPKVQLPKDEVSAGGGGAIPETKSLPAPSKSY